jgi:signal transduction histidine kinase
MAERMARLVRSLQAGAELRNLPLAPLGTQFSALVRQVVDDMLPVAESRSLVLVLEAQPDLMVAADSSSLARVAFTLLDQAVQHSAPGGIIHLSLTRGAGSACLTVSFQVSATSALDRTPLPVPGWFGDPMSAGGGQLDFAIAQLTAESFGGVLEFERGTSGPSRFRLLLPLIGPPSQAAGAR